VAFTPVFKLELQQRKKLSTSRSVDLSSQGFFIVNNTPPSAASDEDQLDATSQDMSSWSLLLLLWDSLGDISALRRML
jgi:hypothetical protein